MNSCVISYTPAPLSRLQSVMSIHALLSRLEIRADSLVLVSESTQYLKKGGGMGADRHLCGELLAV